MSIDEWVGYGLPEEVVEQATRWLARLDAGDLDQQEELAFHHWLDEEPEHRWAFEEVSTIWARTSLITEMEHGDMQDELDEESSASARRFAIRDYLGLLAVGLIVIGLGISFI